MKKLFLFLIIILSCNLFSEDANWIKSYPNHNFLIDISSNPQGDVYVLGFRSKSIFLLKSDSLATDWKIIRDDYPNETKQWLISEKFRFCSPFKNYIYITLEGYRIMKSNNDGKSFDTLKLEIFNPDDNQPTLNYVEGICMADTNVGIASAEKYIFITKDGWKTYQTYNNFDLDDFKDCTTSFSGYNFNAVYAFDKDNYLSFVKFTHPDKKISTGIIRTNDGGKTWNFSPISIKQLDNYPTNYLTNFYFHDRNFGWAVGFRDHEWNSSTGARNKVVIFKTTDGGSTWEQNFEFQGDKYLYTFLQISFRDYKRGIVVGQYGTRFYTTDGGNSWINESSTERSISVERDYQFVTFIGKTAVISTFSGGIYTSTNQHLISNIYEDNNKIEGSIYPNPARDFITIDLREHYLNGIVEDFPKVQIFNLLGLEVMNVDLQNWENIQNIDISNLQTGSYYLRIGKITQKFVKY